MLIRIVYIHKKNENFLHMSNSKSIGQILRRIRREKLWTLQKTCEEADNIIDAARLSRIESTNSMPSLVAGYKIAKALGVKVEDLFNEAEGVISKPSGYEEKIPVLSWVRAGAMCSSPTSHGFSDCDEWISPPRPNMAPNCYALKVRGDSMQAPHGTSFSDGCYIIVDPAMAPENRSYVIAMTRDTEESTFKQLIMDAGQTLLKPLNPHYPIIQANEDMIICGVVTDMVSRIA